MEIKVKRITPIDYPYTIGKMYIDETYFCDTLEDTDRGLSQDMSEEEIKSKKVYGQTAIPTGRYKILMNVVSPKFSKKQFYMDVCKGKVPRLEGVKGFSGILLHCAATADNVEGCIGIGYNTIKGQLTNSKEAFEKMYKKLSSTGEEIWITIE